MKNNVNKNINRNKYNKILIMGVSGCGKSLIGEKIANLLNLNFFDGDDFHSVENVSKMEKGIPLNDFDRVEWLNSLNNMLIKEETAVLACSALKDTYRAVLNQHVDLKTVYLKGDFNTILDRLKLRRDHFFNGEAMLKNQFETLIEPKNSDVIVIDINTSVEKICDEILDKLTNTY